MKPGCQVSLLVLGLQDLGNTPDLRPTTPAKPGTLRIGPAFWTEHRLPLRVAGCSVDSETSKALCLSRLQELSITAKCEGCLRVAGSSLRIHSALPQSPSANGCVVHQVILLDTSASTWSEPGTQSAPWGFPDSVWLDHSHQRAAKDRPSLPVPLVCSSIVAPQRQGQRDDGKRQRV
jgi:hypothetical protein